MLGLVMETENSLWHAQGSTGPPAAATAGAAPYLCLFALYILLDEVPALVPQEGYVSWYDTTAGPESRQAEAHQCVSQLHSTGECGRTAATLYMALCLLWGLGAQARSQHRVCCAT
jgi:hypothetical protein